MNYPERSHYLRFKILHAHHTVHAKAFHRVATCLGVNLNSTDRAAIPSAALTELLEMAQVHYQDINGNKFSREEPHCNWEDVGPAEARSARLF